MSQTTRRGTPGLLRPGVNPDVIMMLCTAGHVDHGKTRLVKLLTGCNTDRLKEEQERGLTIELGFAPCFLGGNLCVGIVDVPGHEKFVKTMVAGVSGIDMAILVVAADDGVMPQTIEHVQIMELLGVRRGLVALTKIDLVSPERVRDVSEEITAFLEGTFLAGAPICPVSSETGEGYFEFYDLLVERITATTRKRHFGVFRMPIERVFLRPGFGTVVTGIPVDGAISVGDTLELQPGGHTGKVRGIQRFLRHADDGGYGQCLALNISDFGKAEPARGQVVCTPGYLRVESQFHLHIRAVSDLDRPLRNAEEIKLHTGTVEVPGKLYLLDGSELLGNQSAYATVITHDPIAAAPRDRVILRRNSPAATVAGGQILLLAAPGERLRKKVALDRLKEMEMWGATANLDGQDGLDRTVEGHLRSMWPFGGSDQDVSRGTFIVPGVVGESLARLCTSGRITELAPRVYIHAESYKACLAEAEKRLRQAPSTSGALSVSMAEMRKSLGWPDALWTQVEQDLGKKGVISVQGGRYLLEASVKELGDADSQLMERILAIYVEQGFHSPRPEELPELLKAPIARVERLLNYLCHKRKLIRIAKNVVLEYTWFKKAQDLVVDEIQRKGVLDSADFKYVIDSSRKYALAILDYLDANRITVRADNNRRLAPNYQKNLK